MTIPTIRVPFVYVEFDSSRAVQGSSVLDYKGLIIAERLAAGTKAALQFDLVQNADQAAVYYGRGSWAHLMARAWFRSNNFTPLYICSVADVGSQATGVFGFTGTATAAGVVSALVNGELIQVTVTSGDSASDVALALATAINENLDLPVTALNSSGNCNLTARNNGIRGNDIDIRLNYYAGENLPTGIACSITAMNGGAGVPNIQNVVDIMGEEWYHIIMSNMADDSNLSIIEAELDSRFGPMRMIDGMYVTSRRGTVSTLSAWGNTRNSKHVTTMHSEKVPNSPAEFAAAYGGQLAYEGSIDPARPFQTLTLPNILPPAIVERFTATENNVLLHDGISTFSVVGGAVTIQRAITMYQVNSSGAEDIAYLDVNTLLTLMYLRYDFRTQIARRFPRAKLADDGVRTTSGVQVLTPKVGKSVALSIFEGWEERGYVENFEQFKNDLVCERDQSDPNRMNWALSPDLMNQFRVGAAMIQFLLHA